MTCHACRRARPTDHLLLWHCTPPPGRRRINRSNERNRKSQTLVVEGQGRSIFFRSRFEIILTASQLFWQLPMLYAFWASRPCRPCGTCVSDGPCSLWIPPTLAQRAQSDACPQHQTGVVDLFFVIFPTGKRVQGGFVCVCVTTRRVCRAVDAACNRCSLSRCCAHSCGPCGAHRPGPAQSPAALLAKGLRGPRGWWAIWPFETPPARAGRRLHGLPCRGHGP